VSTSEFEAKQPPTSKALIGKLAQLLDRNGIDVDDIGKIARVNLWQGMSKDDEGNAVVTDLMGIQLSPSWAEGPAWPVVEPCKPHIVKIKPHPLLKPTVSKGWSTAVVLPDIQIGYYRDRAGELHPTHDEAALSIALQVVKAAKPDRVVLVGDNMDFPELSKYRLTPAFHRTTQATIDRAGLFIAELRAAAGTDCIIDWIAGNHEERLPNYIIDNAVAAFGIRQANKPDTWPIISVPHLIRLDEHQVTYVPGYPAGEVWINDRLRVVHGDKVNSNGSTAHKYLDAERVSTVFGHIHRREWAERTRHTRDGARTVLAMSPGCLCRIDGVVPSTKGGTDLDGLPVMRTEDWQQGLAIFQYEEGDGRFIPEQIPIFEGFAMYRDREYTA
jgi:hypothetical protein